MPTAGASSCSTAGRARRLAAANAPSPTVGGPEVLQRLWSERIPQGRHAERRRAEVRRLPRRRPVTLFRSHRARRGRRRPAARFRVCGDCVDVMLWLLENPQINGLFNLGTGNARSFADLATRPVRRRRQAARLAYIDMPAAIRPNYQYFTEARMERLRERGTRHPSRPWKTACGNTCSAISRSPTAIAEVRTAGEHPARDPRPRRCPESRGARARLHPDPGRRSSGCRERSKGWPCCTAPESA